MSALAAITNVDFGLRIGLTHSQVSRLRSGDRLPSIETMLAIKTELDWSMDDQAQSRLAETYAADLEEKMRGKYGETPTND